MPNVNTSNAVDTFMQSTDAAGMRTNLGLGDSATKAVGTTSGTVAAGDDSRITGAVQTSRTVSAGTGLTGGGDLSANRTLSVSFGTTSTTAAAGNDARFQQTIVEAYGPGGYTISHPFNDSPSKVFADIYLASGGGGGGSGGVASSNNLPMGGSGGAQGIFRRILNLDVTGRSLFATIGAGGAGGAAVIANNDTAGNDGGNGGGSFVRFLSGEDILDAGYTGGLSSSGGQGGGYSAIPMNQATITNGDNDLTYSTPYSSGKCDTNGQVSAIGVPATFISPPYLAPGGAGSAENYDGGDGLDLHRVSTADGAVVTRYGKWSTGSKDATGNAAWETTDADTILKFFNRGIGGSGGAGANHSSYIAGDNPRAGNGSKGSPGCGGGGGGSFRGDSVSTCISGAGGAGGDGFLVVIWKRFDV